MAMISYDIDKQLKILKGFCSSIDMTINTKKTKVMEIKSKRITYTNFMHDSNILEEVTSYKYLKIDIHHKLT